MADYYADSSVLVKRHVNEIGSGWFRTLADPATGNVIIASRVSIIEVYSAFNRRVREASLSPVDYAQLAGDFASIYGTEYQIVELTVVVADRARQHRTADDRLLNAARAEGLAIDNPNVHP
jgi:predicted nucleic acid-binding protein